MPWSVPALVSGLAGPAASQIGPHSLITVALTGQAGLVGLYLWWHHADQTQ